MMSFLKSSELLSPSQYGFRPDHSCIDAVSEVVAGALWGLDGGRVTVAVMLDVSKAFDALSHKILLHKLSRRIPAEIMWKIAYRYHG